MSATDISSAVAALVGARRSGNRIDALPAGGKPADVHAAHAIQEATVQALGERVAGWKVGAPIDGQIVRGALLASRVHASPALIPAAQVPLLGIEAEIAFRFERALPPRERPYSYDEVADAVSAFAAIEIVDSRFRDYARAPLLERIADCVSNGAFVVGSEPARWREHDLVQIHVTLSIGGKVIVDRVGGHPNKDPLLPAVALVNDLQRSSGVAAGQVMTTGTYSGLNYARPGDTAVAVFEGFGSAEVRLSA